MKTERVFAKEDYKIYTATTLGVNEYVEIKKGDMGTLFDSNEKIAYIIWDKFPNMNFFVLNEEDSHIFVRESDIRNGLKWEKPPEVRTPFTRRYVKCIKDTHIGLNTIKRGDIFKMRCLWRDINQATIEFKGKVALIDLNYFEIIKEEI